MPPACAPKYEACSAVIPCCDALHGCFRRRGRIYQQCRPLPGNPCVDDDTWLCPRHPPPAPPVPPAGTHLAAAANFARRLGPGINIMSSNIRWGQLTRLDYLGLGRRVGHVRLCGDFLVNLL